MSMQLPVMPGIPQGIDSMLCLLCARRSPVPPSLMLWNMVNIRAFRQFRQMSTSYRSVVSLSTGPSSLRQAVLSKISSFSLRTVWG
jgi:hypothetical protein